jgi:hypothetical protein
MSAAAAAKKRLFKMRDEEIARMTRQDQVWRLSVIDAAAALNEMPADGEPASRAVVSDDGGSTWLTLSAETGALIRVTRGSDPRDRARRQSRDSHDRYGDTRRRQFM